VKIIQDPALLRPGRLDTILYVGPPDLAARREILKIKTSKMQLLPEMTQTTNTSTHSSLQSQIQPTHPSSPIPSGTNDDDEWIDDDKLISDSTTIVNGHHNDNNKLEHLAHLTDGYSGAEIVQICDEAGYSALRESLNTQGVGWRHFEEALSATHRQITEEMRRGYEEWGAGGVRKI